MIIGTQPYMDPAAAAQAQPAATGVARDALVQALMSQGPPPAAPASFDGAFSSPLLKAAMMRYATQRAAQDKANKAAALDPTMMPGANATLTPADYASSMAAAQGPDPTAMMGLGSGTVPWYFGLPQS